MFILSSLSIDLEFRSVSYISINEDSELKVSKNMKFVAEISNNWLKDLFGTNVYATLECWW